MSGQPFPLAGGSGMRDVDMRETAGGTPTPAAAEGEGLAELDQALGLAAAFFGGDAAVASWAAASDDAEPPAVAGLDHLGLHDDAELDALMGLSGPPVSLQQELVLSLGDAGSGSLVEAGADALGMGGDPEPLTEAASAGGGDAAALAHAAAGAALAAPAASQLAASVGDLQLDDIDSEPSDALAPGAGPLSLEAALAQGPSAVEPAPPPIVPAPTDLAAAEADPLAALEEAVQADKPKYQPSAEWEAMMKSVQGELQEAAEQGQSPLLNATTEGGEQADSAAAGEAAQQQQPDQNVEMGEAVAAAGETDLAPLPSAPGGGEQPPAAAALDLERKRTFGLLQPICSLLLLQRGEPQRLSELLAALQEALREVSAEGLALCADYVLFPLHMMLEAIAATRQPGTSSAASGKGQQPPQQQQGSAAAAGDAAAAGALMALPAMSSDRAAEAALACVLSVLRRCPSQSGDGLLALLRRLAAILELPQGAASEEIRQQALLCLEAAAAGVLQPASPHDVRQALGSEGGASLLGYLFSLMLQVAEAEAQRGSSGSKAVRDAALQAMLRLLQAVAGPAVAASSPVSGDAGPAAAASMVPLQSEAQQAAESLAFFLPGVAVGLCKALLLAASATGSGGRGSAPAGPAASSAAAVAALQALVTLLLACLGDAAVEPLLHGSGSVAAGSRGSAREASGAADADLAAADSSASLQQALQQLQVLAQRAKGGAGSSGSKVAISAAGSPGAQPPHPQEPGRMRVERTSDWVLNSAERLHQLLSTALPPLLAHQRAAVRQTLVQGCCRLLDECSMALQPRTQEALLQLLLSAAQDEWREVAGPARTWLASHAAAASASEPATSAGQAGSAFAAALEHLLLQLLEGLPAALRRGDLPGRQHAQQLTSAIQVCQPGWFAANVLHHPLHLQQLLDAFLETFAFDASCAGMLLYAAAPPAGAATSHAPGGQPTSGDAVPAGRQDSNADVQSSSMQPQGQQQGQQLAESNAVVLLPRMPLGLSLVTTAKTYEAVAAAVRATATLAAAADATPGGSGTALRTLVDGCLSRLQQLLSTAEGSSGRRDRKRGGQQPAAPPAVDLAGPGQAPWQLQAAAVAVVLAELLLGASPAWQPSWSARTAADPATMAAAAELEQLAAAVVQELVSDAIWSLPTSVPAAGPDVPGGAGSGSLLEAPGQQGLSAQLLGCNALLQRAALECCGTATRALGPRFAQNGRLLRATLLPLLEKLADATPLVSAAAQAAVGGLCWWCGYGGSLRQLVAANADYVVDGMCAQLRQLDAHPRAPQLFTALLQQAGVAPELLPLLAEPARNAVQGLGILARRQQPQHVLAFLQTLAPVAAAAGAVARQVLADMRSVAAEVQQRWDARQAELDAAEAAVLAAAGGDRAAATQAEVRAFFEQRAAAQRAQEQVGELGSGGEQQGHPVEQLELEEESRKVFLSSAEREEVSLLRRHGHAAGTLAQAVADAASPLAMSQSLQVAVQSCGVVACALRALAAVTEAVELDVNQVQLVTRRRTDVAPPDPDTPRMLPSVHLAWAPLMGALQDWRVSVVEAALQFLADCTCLSGSFLRKRFAREAAPVLQRLLVEGPAHRNIIAPGRDDVSSPAAVQRAQLAVLLCLEQIASYNTPLAIAGVSSSASDALLPALPTLLPAVGDAMGSHHPAHVRERATQTYIALARVDPDAAWCQLTAASHAAGRHAVGGTAIAGDVPCAPAPRPTTGLKRTSEGTPLVFPEQCHILPPLPAQSGAPAEAALRHQRGAAKCGVGLVVPAGLVECSAAKLSAMLHEVEKMPLPWHAHISA